MSETPISDSTPHNVGDLAMVCRRLERKLAATRKYLSEVSERAKRLEEAGSKLDKTADPFVLYAINEDFDEGPMPMSEVSEHYEITYDSPPTAGDHVAMDRARKDWRKAKEAKP
jgi:hypothetical protein